MLYIGYNPTQKVTSKIVGPKEIDYINFTRKEDLSAALKSISTGKNIDKYVL